MTAKPKAILQNLQNPIAVDGLLFARFGLQDCKNDVLFSGTTDVFDAQAFGHFNEFVYGLSFEFCEVHGGVLEEGLTIG